MNIEQLLGSPPPDIRSPHSAFSTYARPHSPPPHPPHCPSHSPTTLAHNDNYDGGSLRRHPKERRPRTTFSADQSGRLEEEYRKNEYISKSKRVRLAQSLQLNEGQIKIWFQNRRAKDKRIEKAHMDNRLSFVMAESWWEGHCERFAELLMEGVDEEAEYQAVAMEQRKNRRGTHVLIDYLVRSRDPAETHKQKEEEERTTLKLWFLQLHEYLIQTLQMVGEDVGKWESATTDPAVTLELMKVATSKLREAKELTSMGKHKLKRTYLDHLKHMNRDLRQYHLDTDDTQGEGAEGTNYTRRTGTELSRLKRVLREMGRVVEDGGEEETIPKELEDEVGMEGAKKRIEIKCVQDQRMRSREERVKKQQMKTQVEALQMEMQAMKRHIEEEQQGKLTEMKEDTKKYRELKEELKMVRSANEELQRQEEEEKKEEGRLTEETEGIPQGEKELKGLEEREKAEEEELKATIQQVEEMRTTVEGKNMERVEAKIRSGRAELKELLVKKKSQETAKLLKKNQLDVVKRIVNEGGKVSPGLVLKELMAVQTRKTGATETHKRVEQILGGGGVEGGSHPCCLSPEFVPDLREAEERVRRRGVGRLTEVTQQLDDSLNNTPTNVKIPFATTSHKKEKEVRDCVAAADEEMRQLVKTLEERVGTRLEGVKEVAGRIDGVAQKLGVSRK